MRRIVCWLVAARLLVLPALASAGLVVVMHPERDERPSKQEIAQIFLRQKRFWADGSRIVPLNRRAGTPERELFSRAVLGSGSRRQSSYWDQQSFDGTFPPAVLSSDAAVLRYVSADPRAIGYVDAAVVDDSVLTVLRLD